MTVRTTHEEPVSRKVLELLCLGWVQLLLIFCCLFGGMPLLSHTVGTTWLDGGVPVPKYFFVLLRQPSVNNALEPVNLDEVPSYRRAHPDATLYMSAKHGKLPYAEYTVLAEEKGALA